MVRVKICGITNLDDALAAVGCGADALGFVFWAGSQRHISAAVAAEIVKELPPFITTVGVFVNETRSRIDDILAEVPLCAVQLHGDETPEFCSGFDVKVIKAVRVRDKGDIEALSDYDVSAFLLDSYREGFSGGTGVTFDWSLATGAKMLGPVIVSGGLTPDNVAEAVRVVRPYGVDVSSGVEKSPGRKDSSAICSFIAQARIQED